MGSALQKTQTWNLGDAVYGLCSRPIGEGTFTKYLKVTPGSDPIARKPDAWTHEQAAAVPLVVLTAFSCLDWVPDMRRSPNPQRRVVVSGASGGVGTWCVQLAKRVYDCHVTGICSARNAEFVRALGADEIVDYGTEHVATSLLDKRPGAGNIFGVWYELLHRNGAYVSIVGDKTSRTVLGGPVTYFSHPAQLWRYVYGYLFGPRYATVFLHQKSELLEQVARLAEEERLEVVLQHVVGGILSEEGHGEAWGKVREYMVAGRVRGKIVVSIA